MPFLSTGDAIAALELLHQSQVKVTIKTGAQILLVFLSFCRTVQKITVGVATGCRSSLHMSLKSAVCQCPNAQRKILGVTYSPICDNMVTTSKALIRSPEFGVYRRQPPAKKKRHLPFILKGSRNVSCAGSLPSGQPLHQQIVPHADHQAAVKLVNFSVSTSFSYAYLYVRATTSSCNPLPEVTYRYL